ncbi:hypothetical protein TNCV_5017741 [Trichonephila clavipes]|nr:hypothetical protein TNCV_5017741 [Trichonephila clavipes]
MITEQLKIVTRLNKSIFLISFHQCRSLPAEQLLDSCNVCHKQDDRASWNLEKISYMSLKSSVLVEQTMTSMNYFNIIADQFFAYDICLFQWKWSTLARQHCKVRG